MAFGASDAAARGIAHDGIPTTFPAGSILEYRTGARPANANTAPTGTVVASQILPATPWGAGAGRGVPKSGTWEDTSADNAGTITWGRLKTAGDNGTTDSTQPRLDFDVVQSPSSGDCVIDNATVTAGQKVTTNSFTVTL